MQLTVEQQDALVELLNIGFGRAAASLSQLTGHRVLQSTDDRDVRPHPFRAERNFGIDPMVGGFVARREHQHAQPIERRSWKAVHPQPRGLPSLDDVDHLERERHGECRALTLRPVLRLDLAPVQLDELAHQRQADPQPPGGACR